MVFRREVDDDDTQSNDNSDFEAMLNESFGKNQKRLKAGDKVRAEVLSLGRDHIIVSTGTPDDGLVPRAELVDEQDRPKVTVGDKIDLYVTRIRGNEVTLSTSSTGGDADDVMDAYSRGIAVDGKVDEAINGGFRVTVMGKRAFCPISQMDTRHIEQTDGYIGKKFEFRITQFKNGGRDLVVSRRKLLEEQKGVAQTQFLSEKQVGDVVTGTITRLEKFGAFVEIAPGIEGLAHISELSWSRVADPKDVVESGQQVTAKILKIEGAGTDRAKISLSLKQVQEQPWLSLPAGLEEGKVIEGKVTRCLKFGAFVELFPGIEGLIPLSEMSYTKRVAKSDELVTEGEKISVKIKSVDAFARRISLSLRDAEGTDPWTSAGSEFAVGKIVEGTVEKREAYGLFIKIAEGVTGLFPKSKANEHPEFGYDRLKPGDKVKVRVADVKAGERRISLAVPSDDGGGDWKSYVSDKATTATSSQSPFGMLGEQMKAALNKTTKK